jgi:alpha-D-ribose 1-methylphosphonate 5-triphosphate synthase subunit PhnH
MQQIDIAPGFADAVTSAQQTFRRVMDAMARPGTIHDVGADFEAPGPVLPATAALALTLFDHDTPVFIDPSLGQGGVIAAWLRFHTGCPIAERPDAAAFALIGEDETPIAPEQFALGTQDYPDRSTTLIVQRRSLDQGALLRLTGPGIRAAAELRVAPLPADFIGRHAANRALFPRGVDLVFVAGSRLVALPRTTVVTGE